MRDVKFRGSRNDLSINHVNFGDWVYGFYVKSNGFLYIYQNGTHIPIKPGTVGQFTDRNDKHGVEIYEGDSLDFLWEGCVDKKREQRYQGKVVSKKGEFLCWGEKMVLPLRYGVEMEVIL